MPGIRGQAFGRRRGMKIRTGRNTTMGRNLFGSIRSWIQTKNISDQLDDSRPSTEDSDQLNGLIRLKQQAESVQNQLEEINRRIIEIEKKPNSPFAKIDDTTCTGCGHCVQLCPQGAITLKNNISKVDRIKCTGCGLCASECPVGAIDLIG